MTPLTMSKLEEKRRLHMEGYNKREERKCSGREKDENCRAVLSINFHAH